MDSEIDESAKRLAVMFDAFLMVNDAWIHRNGEIMTRNDVDELIEHFSRFMNEPSHVPVKLTAYKASLQ